MSARVDLQSIPVGYFIDWRGALGVMTGQYTLLEYQAAGFSTKREGFFLEQCFMDCRTGILCGFCAKGQLFSRVRLKIVPGCIQRKQNSQMQNTKRIITEQVQNSKVLHLLPIFTHP
jgi:hypothetical protein